MFADWFPSSFSDFSMLKFVNLVAAVVFASIVLALIYLFICEVVMCFEEGWTLGQFIGFLCSGCNQKLYPRKRRAQRRKRRNSHLRMRADVEKGCVI